MRQPLLTRQPLRTQLTQPLRTQLTVELEHQGRGARRQGALHRKRREHWKPREHGSKGRHWRAAGRAGRRAPLAAAAWRRRRTTSNARRQYQEIDPPTGGFWPQW